MPGQPVPPAWQPRGSQAIYTSNSSAGFTPTTPTPPPGSGSSGHPTWALYIDIADNGYVLSVEVGCKPLTTRVCRTAHELADFIESALPLPPNIGIKGQNRSGSTEFLRAASAEATTREEGNNG
jgi:hypothetical protein